MDDVELESHVARISKLVYTYKGRSQVKNENYDTEKIILEDHHIRRIRRADEILGVDVEMLEPVAEVHVGPGDIVADDGNTAKKPRVPLDACCPDTRNKRLNPIITILRVICEFYYDKT